MLFELSAGGIGAEGSTGGGGTISVVPGVGSDGGEVSEGG